MINLILLVAAFILALLEALSPYFWTAPKRPHLGWLAVALALLSMVIHA